VKTFLSDRKFIIAFSVWWLSWAEVHAIVLNKFGLPFRSAFPDSLISNALLAACCLLIGMNMQFYLPRKERFWYVLVVSSVLTIIWVFVSKFILQSLFTGDERYMNMLGQSMLIRFAIGFLVTGCMAMISMTWYGQKEQREMDERKAEAEQLAKEAELFKLRQQLQPHFLFNSLNSISALTGTQPEKARNMINQLSEFLRGTLKKDEKQWNTLEEEMQYLQLYLDIEKVRFGYRLQTEILCDEESVALRLPAMLLQPVVENAIKFGLYDTTGEVRITIAAKKLDGYLEVNVQNPFDPETYQPLKGTGFGLASIQRRLFLLFARNDLLKTQKEDDHFITTILIPQNI
jgi:sensor histidine kinase YesM